VNAFQKRSQCITSESTNGEKRLERKNRFSYYYYVIRRTLNTQIHTVRNRTIFRYKQQTRQKRKSQPVRRPTWVYADTEGRRIPARKVRVEPVCYFYAPVRNSAVQYLITFTYLLVRYTKVSWPRHSDTEPDITICDRVTAGVLKSKIKIAPNRSGCPLFVVSHVQSRKKCTLGQSIRKQSAKQFSVFAFMRRLGRTEILSINQF